MLLLRSLPDSSHKDSTPQDSFRARWGRESCIIWGRARHADFGPHEHTLSIRAAWGGALHCHVEGRTVAVDDDSFLILNHGRICSTSIRAVQPVESLTICFHASLAAEVRGAADFLENLQPHEKTVSPVLRFIRAHLSRGHLDEHWYEEQLLFLLERMLVHHRKVRDHIDGLALGRAATRREVYRRVGLATDFLHTHYARAVDLSMLAGVASMSKFHFLRLFTLIHGVTPRGYLQRKRVFAGARLLRSSHLTISDVAARVGFAHESTFVRQMRRWTSLTPREFRSGSPSEAAVRFPQSPPVKTAIVA